MQAKKHAIVDYIIKESAVDGHTVDEYIIDEHATNEQTADEQTANEYTVDEQTANEYTVDEQTLGSDMQSLNIVPVYNNYSVKGSQSEINYFCDDFYKIRYKVTIQIIYQ